MFEVLIVCDFGRQLWVYHGPRSKNNTIHTQWCWTSFYYHVYYLANFSRLGWVFKSGARWYGWDYKGGARFQKWGEIVFGATFKVGARYFGGESSVLQGNTVITSTITLYILLWSILGVYQFGYTPCTGFVLVLGKQGFLSYLHSFLKQVKPICWLVANVKEKTIIR